jgi:hypothetical protein
MEVSGQLHAPAALPPGKEPEVGFFYWFVHKLVEMKTRTSPCYPQIFTAFEILIIND